jgi:hypothetical protein
MNRRPRLTIVAPSASPEEAAAVVAAVEQFMRETAPLRVSPKPDENRWLRSGLFEGVGREPTDPLPWG